mmetsp:Transcript_15898/g.50652  ORF Transcript_15898/g.50652 Transcript_15898/m.50652 type:complete len:90 (-) Transcript_15898:821-1090(-)
MMLRRALGGPLSTVACDHVLQRQTTLISPSSSASSLIEAGSLTLLRKMDARFCTLSVRQPSSHVSVELSSYFKLVPIPTFVMPMVERHF